jgi:DNA polymerase-3 subunit epsilon
VKEYLLFVDTETSGLPKDWSKPYSVRGNWPHVVQVAWVLYSRDGKKLKEENFYIRPSDYEVSPTSQRIHGLSEDFLRENGKDRNSVMQLLHADLIRYQPLVVGHFMQLDYHMLGLSFYRSGLENPLPKLPHFCTMRATAHFMRESSHRHLRLGELYMRLFQTPLQDEHNALSDASATAHCFFKLWKKGDIDEETVQQQQLPVTEAARTKRSWKRKITYLLRTLFAFFLIFLLIYWLYA